MKSYLLFPLFFLGALSLPISIISQENTSEQHPAKTETPVDSSSIEQHSDHSIEQQADHSDQRSDLYPIQQDIDHRDLPDTWPERSPHTAERIPSEADSFQTKFFNMLFILGLLIGFMMLASWALKRMMKSKMTQLNTASSIKVLETRYLSPRATLYLIEVQDQSFLIAESPTTVTYLTAFPMHEEEQPSESPPPFPPPKKF